MKDYTVENPVFFEKISIVEEEDLVSAENDTAAAKQLIQNDLALSKRMKQCLGDAPEHGDSKDLVITFESGDEESVDGWTDVPVMQNVEDHKTIFRKISNMVKNVRYLYNLLGTTDISGCGADTVTGAIKKLSERKIPNVTRSASVTQEGQQALDAVEKNAAVPGTMAYDLAQINSKIVDAGIIFANASSLSHVQYNSIKIANMIAFRLYCTYDGTIEAGTWYKIGSINTHVPAVSHPLTISCPQSNAWIGNQLVAHVESDGGIYISSKEKMWNAIVILSGIWFVP